MSIEYLRDVVLGTETAPENWRGGTNKHALWLKRLLRGEEIRSASGSRHWCVRGARLPLRRVDSLTLSRLTAHHGQYNPRLSLSPDQHARLFSRTRRCTRPPSQSSMMRR